MWDDGSTNSTLWVTESYVFANGNVISLDVTDAHGCVASDDVIVEFEHVGILENNPAMIDVFPNPVHDRLILRSNTGNSYSIIDNLGKTVMQGSMAAGEQNISVLELNPGYYHILIEASELSIRKSFIKQ